MTAARCAQGDSCRVHGYQHLDPLTRAAEMARADNGHFRVEQDAPIEEWAEFVDDVVYSLRRAGWAVTPPAHSDDPGGAA